jgi:hypothetical protein
MQYAWETCEMHATFKLENFQRIDRYFEVHVRTWSNDIERNILERRAWGCGLDSTISGISQVVGYCEHGVESWDLWKASLSEWLMDTQRIVTFRVDWLDMKRRNRDDCIFELFTDNRRSVHYSVIAAPSSLLSLLHLFVYKQCAMPLMCRRWSPTWEWML